MPIKFSEEQLIDFIILALRWYLAFYMVDYGIGKITGSQFGVVDPKIIAAPMKDINPFYVAWYLFGQSRFFNVATGVIEIAGAILIVIQIWLIDASFTTGMFGYALVFRLAGMIVSDLLILYYYRDRLMAAWNNLSSGLTTKFRYKWWIYLLLPVIGFLMDFILRVFTWPVQVIFQHLRH
jgi:hypothetical protein